MAATLTPPSEDKIHRQLANEQESVELGVRNYRKQIKTKKLGDLPPGQRLIRAAIEPLAQAIGEFKAATGGGRLYNIRHLFDLFDTEELAYLTARYLINCMAGDEKT